MRFETQLSDLYTVPGNRFVWIGCALDRFAARMHAFNDVIVTSTNPRWGYAPDGRLVATPLITTKKSDAAVEKAFDTSHMRNFDKKVGIGRWALRLLLMEHWLG
jgi:hypothetical protein